MLNDFKGGRMQRQTLINLIGESLIPPIREFPLELRFADGMADRAYGQIFQFFHAFANHLFPRL